MKFEGVWASCKFVLNSTDNLMQKILRKNKKPSKVRQNQKTLMFDFAYFLKACSKHLLLQGRLDTSLCLSRLLQFSDFLIFVIFGDLKSTVAWELVRKLVLISLYKRSKSVLLMLNGTSTKTLQNSKILWTGLCTARYQSYSSVFSIVFFFMAGFLYLNKKSICKNEKCVLFAFITGFVTLWLCIMWASSTLCKILCC